MIMYKNICHTFQMTNHDQTKIDFEVVIKNQLMNIDLV